MSRCDQLAAVEMAQTPASDSNGYLQSVNGVLVMGVTGTPLDATHAMHCAELIIDLVRQRLSEAETLLRPVIDQLRKQVT